MSKLPSNWTMAPLGDLLTEVLGGGTPDKSKLDNFRGDIPFMTVKDMHSRFIDDTQDHISKEALASSASRVIPADTLVIASRMSLGKIARPTRTVAINQDLKALFLQQGVSKPYIEYVWRANAERIQAMGTGTTVKGIRLEDIRGLEVPVAPAAEQTRIANQLDALLARIQACHDRLEAIPALLKRLRQAVLRAATSGDLTRDERSRFDWSSDWTPRQLTALGELARGKSKHRPRNDPRLYGGPYPFVQTGDVAQSGGLITKHRQTYSELGLQQSRLWPAGTLCITIAANIADTALLTYPACFPDSVVGFIADTNQCEALFVKWSIDVVKDDIEALAPATAQKNINLSVLNEVVIRTPDLAEQREIVRRGKALLAIADRIEARYVTALRHSKRLASLTLAKAFRGELIPQDPTDEPASILLERIRSSKASPAPATTGKARTRRPDLKAAAEQTLLNLIDQMGKAEFTFDELRQHSSREYESLKAELFSLLVDKKSGLDQYFDEAEGSMKLRRTSI